MSERICTFWLARHVPVWLMAVITGFIETAIACRLLKDEITAGYAIAAHLLVLAAIAFQALLAMKKGADLSLSFLLFCFTLALGPGGAAATFMTAAMTSTFARSATPFEDWYHALFPETASFTSGILEEIRAAGSHEDRSIMPLIDVLAFGTHAQKQALLTLVTSNFKPPFAAVLKTALNDANNAIRVQAATGITKIETDFTARAVDLTRRTEQSANNPELLKEIAQHYDQYAYIGLLEHDRETDCRSNALRYYARYLVLQPEDLAARVAVGRILIRDQRYAEALDWFERAGADERSSDEALWYVESLFRTGHFEKLRSLLTAKGKELQHGAGLPLEIREALRLWLAGNAEGTA